MELLTVQVEKNTLQLAQIEYSGGAAQITDLRSFFLPGQQEATQFMKDGEAVSVFLSECIRESGLKSSKLVMLLPAFLAVHKEYIHEEAKQADLLRLAKLEAEAVLPEAFENYAILNQEHGTLRTREGQLRSTVYAVEQSYIDSLSQGLSKAGLKLLGLLPETAVYARLLSSLVLAEDRGELLSRGTVLALDMTRQGIKFLLLSQGEVVHQRIFSGAMDELISELSRVSGWDSDRGEDFCLKNGLDLSTEGYEGEENRGVYDCIAGVVGNTLQELLQSAHIILANEKLELSAIIISGSYSLIPGMLDFISDYVDVPCHNIAEYKDCLKDTVVLSEKLTDLAFDFPRVLLLGIPGYQKSDTLNFLTEGFKRKKEHSQNTVVCCIIALLTLALMGALPVSYLLALKDYKAEETKLTEPLYEDASMLLKEKENLTAACSVLSRQEEALEEKETESAAALRRLNTLLYASVNEATIAYNVMGKEIDTTFLVKDLDTAVKLKNQVNDSPFFRVDTAMTLEQISGWLCQWKISVITPGEKEGIAQ